MLFTRVPRDKIEPIMNPTMNPTGTVYLLCGPAFTGKSTLAEAIVRHIGCACISLDEINVERGLPHGESGLPTERWAETHQFALERLEELARAGRDVVVDDTNCYRFLRDNYREVARRHGYRVVVVHLDIHLAEIQRRRRANGVTRRRHRIRDEIFDPHIVTFEYADPDEERLVFGPDDEPETWLQAHFSGP